MSRFLPEERAQILESADRLARERLAPVAPRMDAEEWWPDEVFRALGSMATTAVRDGDSYVVKGRSRAEGERRPLIGRVGRAANSIIFEPRI